MEAVFMMVPPLFLEVKFNILSVNPKFSYLNHHNNQSNMELMRNMFCFVIADISMRGHLIVYDNVKRRIGWMKSDCVRPREFDHNVPFFQG